MRSFDLGSNRYQTVPQTVPQAVAVKVTSNRQAAGKAVGLLAAHETTTMQQVSSETQNRPQ